LACLSFEKRNNLTKQEAKIGLVGQGRKKFMKNYILAHGFGFTHDYWQHLTPLLDGNIYYFDGKNMDAGREYIGVGHSLGFLKLNNATLNFSHLIGLQGFLDFCGRKNSLQKIIEPQLDEAIENFSSNPKIALKNFYEMCGYFGDIPGNISRETLLFELKMMKKFYSHCGVKTLILSTSNDVVVPTAIIGDNFSAIDGVSVKILNLEIKHTLGFHGPEIVANEIKQFTN
jgi:pimeloyl-[acyl-carrier protein] methyl ester esterase